MHAAAVKHEQGLKINANFLYDNQVKQNHLVIQLC
jgi:hypothetical protein